MGIVKVGLASKDTHNLFEQLSYQKEEKLFHEHFLQKDNQGFGSTTKGVSEPYY